MCLLEKGYIKKEDIESALEISDLTFRRYMQELRAYFDNFSLPHKLVYLRDEGIYKITN